MPVMNGLFRSLDSRDQNSADCAEPRTDEDHVFYFKNSKSDVLVYTGIQCDILIENKVSRSTSDTRWRIGRSSGAYSPPGGVHPVENRQPGLYSPPKWRIGTALL